MMETMREQQVEFANKIWENELSHKTDLRFSSPKFDVYLCVDGASFPPLESGLEATLNHPLITSSLVASSSPSTFRDNTTLTMTFPNPPFPLAQLTEFDIGETFGVSARVDKDDTCY